MSTDKEPPPDDPCGECDGEGWVYDENNDAIDCPDCQGTGVEPTLPEPDERKELR